MIQTPTTEIHLLKTSAFRSREVNGFRGLMFLIACGNMLDKVLHLVAKSHNIKLRRDERFEEHETW
jgi:hypothetical protein